MSKSLMFAGIIIGLNATTIDAKELYEEPMKITCTAYSNEFESCNDICADGSKPVEGLTIAGKREWLGKTAILYECDEDGEIGDFIGFYEFRDTGFGTDKDGDGVGTIQEGKCVDIFMESEAACNEWGRRKIYIQIVDAEG